MMQRQQELSWAGERAPRATRRPRPGSPSFLALLALPAYLALPAFLALGCASPCEKLVNAVCDRLEDGRLCVLFRNDYKPADEAKQQLCKERLPEAEVLAQRILTCNKLIWEVCARMRNDELCTAFAAKTPETDPKVQATCEARLAQVDDIARDEVKLADMKQQLQKSPVFKQILRAISGPVPDAGPPAAKGDGGARSPLAAPLPVPPDGGAPR